MRIIPLNGQWTHGLTEDKLTNAVPVPANRREYKGFENYAGESLYYRDFDLSEEDLAKHLELRFAGVRRKACIFLNGEFVLSHRGSQAPFRADITEFVRPGKNRVSVRVDDRHILDIPNAPLFDIIPVPISGIYDSVSLEISEKAYVRSIYAPVCIETKTVHLQVVTENRTNEAENANLTIEASDIKNGNTVLTRSFGLILPPGESQHKLNLPLESFRLWSPEEPNLYEFRLSLTTRGMEDVFTGITGLKSLEARGKEFYLNGEPYYLLGYGDDFVYPDGAPSATDRDFYRFGLERVKAYGFNYARHHSHFPYEAFFDAADELGLLIQPELEIANIPRELLNDESRDYFLSEWKELILAYRHHPCIAMWCGGNEMEWGYPFDSQLYDIAKELDPYRMASSTDGNFMACDVTCAQDYASICPAEYTDYLPWRELSDMFTRDCSGKPQIVHEMGNYATVPDIHSISKYESAIIPPRKEQELKQLVEEKRLEEFYEKTLTCSHSLQKLCHKLNIEKARLSPDFCGYHLWTITDYYDTTQGLLDRYYGDKSFTAEEFSLINSQEVLLWERDRAVFSSGEEIVFDLRLSRYGSDLPVNGELTIRISDITETSIAVNAEGHGILSLVSYPVKLPRTEKEKVYTLTASLVCRGKEIRNSWEFFVVPEVKIDSQREIYLNYVSKYIFAGENIPLRHFTIPQPIGENQLIVTGFLYGGMTEAVERGANLLLLADADTFEHTVTKNSFKAPWWDIGEIWYLNHSNNKQICGIVEAEKSGNIFPCSGGWKLDLFGAVEQAPAVDIDESGLDVTPIVYGVDSRLHRYAYLFEFRLGKGNVMVCTFNRDRNDLKDPAVRYYIKSLINRAMSPDFTPKKELSADAFYSALKKN